MLGTRNRRAFFPPFGTNKKYGEYFLFIMKFFCDIVSGVNIRNQKYFDEMVNKEIKNWVTRCVGSSILKFNSNFSPIINEIELPFFPSTFWFSCENLPPPPKFGDNVIFRNKCTSRKDQIYWVLTHILWLQTLCVFIHSK